MGAAATIAPPPESGRRGIAPAGGGRLAALAPDSTTVQRLDLPRPPTVTAGDEFLEFLFSGSELKYADLKTMSQQQEDLPRFSLKGVTLTFNLDADYQVVNTQYTRNVIGVVEGSDPQLMNTYVAFGAHYDHVGYTQGAIPEGATDRIYNGADDDGSGTAAMITAMRQKAFRSFSLRPFYIRTITASRTRWKKSISKRWRTSANWSTKPDAVSVTSRTRRHVISGDRGLEKALLVRLFPQTS